MFQVINSSVIEECFALLGATCSRVPRHPEAFPTPCEPPLSGKGHCFQPAWSALWLKMNIQARHPLGKGKSNPNFAGFMKFHTQVPRPSAESSGGDKTIPLIASTKLVDEITSVVDYMPAQSSNGWLPMQRSHSPCSRWDFAVSCRNFIFLPTTQ